MEGIQYINSPEGSNRYAVVDLKLWGDLFNHFLEEVEDTLAYDQEIGKDIDREKLLSVLREKLVNTDLSFHNSENSMNGKLNGSNTLPLQVDNSIV